ncbi:Exosome complex exonuclease rrp6 [Tetrabaena socialis]|uniref:Exosome complex exonuclease rrp6 n=1 Tax=Tetrabaena socialis TaxID=47790 RepID=A0A2J8AHB6_9CHLO|nr:Exosome complex exonuclease rrp6 [Tetrabaena socialis]|eukprot:PNH11912.1 Exosome complex exonuclease rrp6 [Tetrabaena socialis]
MVAPVLGYESRALAALLRRHCGGVAVDKAGGQRADWRRRPLPPPLLSYAATDVSYLPYLADVLRAELAAAGPGGWPPPSTDGGGGGAGGGSAGGGGGGGDGSGGGSGDGGGGGSSGGGGGGSGDGGGGGSTGRLTSVLPTTLSSFLATAPAATRPIVSRAELRPPPATARMPYLKSYVASAWLGRYATAISV